MEITVDELRRAARLLGEQGRFEAPRKLIELVTVLLNSEEPSAAFVDAEHNESTASVHWIVLAVVGGRLCQVTARSEVRPSVGLQPKLLEHRAVSWSLLSVQALAVVETQDQSDDVDDSVNLTVRWAARMSDGNLFEFPMPLGGFNSAQRRRADALAAELLKAVSWRPAQDPAKDVLA